ncbi:MAG: beta-hexosaminidase [Clostridia bacterium]|nr:beta-hexosaminidase [Clostridia bacterium]
MNQTHTKEKTMTDMKKLLNQMTLEEKVGQMFVARRPQDPEVAMKAVTDYHLGGFTLYACDFEHRDPETIRSLLDSYQETAKIPMFIAADCEGGRVIRASKYPAFRESGFPSPRQLDAEGGLDRVAADTEEKARFLLDLGVNFNYAPVCDMSGNPECFIFDRTYSNDPEATAAYAETVVSVMNREHIVGSIKHFPGYGDNVDTHTSIAHDDRPLSQFLEKDLKPFETGIKAGAPIVMVAHNIVSCMDPDCPASLSPAVHKFLRENMGFEGLIMTDSLDMNAITLYTGDQASAVAAVLSGNDLLCCTTYDQQMPAVLEAVRNGIISEARIDESVKKILELKAKMNII